ncbi:MAG: hypothetical protein M3Q60_23430 [Actinomycetota bacterium]|nr:hypothetical protein [Actinomycetota bacterium]
MEEAIMRETLRWGSPRCFPISVWDLYITLGKTGMVSVGSLAFRAVLSLTRPATLEVVL